MVEKLLKCAAKNVAFVAMDIVVPGSGYIAKRICRIGNMAEMLGPRATPDQIIDLVDTEESISDCIHNMIEGFLDLD